MEACFLAERPTRRCVECSIAEFSVNSVRTQDHGCKHFSCKRHITCRNIYVYERESKKVQNHGSTEGSKTRDETKTAAKETHRSRTVSHGLTSSNHHHHSQRVDRERTSHRRVTIYHLSITARRGTISRAIAKGRRNVHSENGRISLLDSSLRDAVSTFRIFDDDC